MSVATHIKEYIKTCKQSEISASQLFGILYPKEKKRLSYIINKPFTSRQEKIKARRKKENLQRRIVYALNNLEKQNIVSLLRKEKAGHKVFQVHHNLMSASTRTSNVSPINNQFILNQEQLLTNKALSLYSPHNWLKSINTMLLDITSQKTLHKIKEQYEIAQVYTNDCLGIIGCEDILHNNPKAFISLTRKAMKKTILLLDEKRLNQDSISYITKIIKSKNVFIQILLDKKDITKKGILRDIIKAHQISKKRLYIQKRAICNAPILLGDIGLYSISSERYNRYLKSKVNDNINSLCYAIATNYIDTKEVFKPTLSFAKFRDKMLECSKEIFYYNYLYRRYAHQNLKELMQISGSSRLFFENSIHYIRLRNLDYLQRKCAHLTELIGSFARQFKELHTEQERIYKISGIPAVINIKISTFIATKNKQKISRKIYLNTELSFDSIRNTSLKLILNLLQKWCAASKHPLVELNFTKKTTTLLDYIK